MLRQFSRQLDIILADLSRMRWRRFWPHALAPHSTQPMQSNPLTDFCTETSDPLYEFDAGQQNAIKQLQQLLAAINARGGKHSAGLRRLFGKSSRIAGIYLWGGVGRGKTHLMDHFFACVSFKEKKRIHFHRFMQMIHGQLKDRRNTADPLDYIGREFARECRLLCLDEFFVLDIGDAVILAKLLQSLLANGVVLVMTSNTEPHRLYQGGIQRDRFVPAIGLIESTMRIVHIGDGVDYRLKSLDDTSLYFSATAEAAATIQNSFFNHPAAKTAEPPYIEILGRRIKTVQRTDTAVWFEFDQLCEGPRSKADYIEIANIYRTVIITNIPELTWEYENPARRFIELVDEFYDRGVHLVISAHRGIDSLYSGKRLVAEFERTASRLHEMQTREYLSKMRCM